MIILAVSIPEQEFFFDFITQVTQWSLQTQPTKPSTSTLAYQIIFMRKLWIDVRPGTDLAADLFHYYQVSFECLQFFQSPGNTKIPPRILWDK